MVRLLNHLFSPGKPNSQQRFKLLRNFSIISLSGFVLTTGLLSALYRQQAVKDLVISTEESNVALTQVFSNTLWPDYGAFLSSTQDLSDEALTNAPRTQQLNEDVIAQLEGLSVAKVKVYDLQERTVFSTDATQIGDDKSESSGFLAAKSGQVVSQLGHRDTFKALKSTLENREFLSSYIPIYEGGREGTIVGVFEVYADVTPLLVRIRQTQTRLSLGSLAVLSVLYSVLFIFMQQADKLITRQYQQVQSSESRYRNQSSELENALSELKEAQAQMLQSEKMSSLGQMVAGVAHEINNPVNFIHGNLKHIGDYTQDLRNLLSLYEAHYPKPDDEIQSLTEELDIDFLREDMTKILSSMKMGTERIREIVRSLRNFSRMDEAERKDVDIHDGLESTLMILQHRLKAQPDRPAIQIVRDFDELPKVECYAGQLNQVFMNVLSNGIDALEEKLKSNPADNSTEESTPQITIRTETRENSVVVSIADNGNGIPPAVKDRIFDPFFTTKAVGKGTGMGMAISYQLITEKHNGKIECFSDEGIGTEFIIELPLALASE